MRCIRKPQTPPQTDFESSECSRLLALSFAKTPSSAMWLICRLRSGDNPSSMITLLLHLLRRLPWVWLSGCGSPAGSSCEASRVEHSLAVHSLPVPLTERGDEHVRCGEFVSTPAHQFLGEVWVNERG